MVIVAALTTQLFSTTDGIVYHFLVEIFGRNNAPDVMSNPNLFVPMLIGQSMWKETGYGTIIFLAALSGVDVQLYDCLLYTSGLSGNLSRLPARGSASCFLPRRGRTERIYLSLL